MRAVCHFCLGKIDKPRYFVKLTGRSFGEYGAAHKSCYAKPNGWLHLTDGKLYKHTAAGFKLA